MTPGITQYDT